MPDIRKIVIIFVVAILFSVLVFAVIEAVYPAPKTEDYCKNQYMAYPQKIAVAPISCNSVNVSAGETASCDAKHGYIEYEYDSLGCAISYKCNTCDYEYRQADAQHSRYVFYISAILALIAIFIGLYLPAAENSLNEWVGTGFMLGGAFALFFGTAISYTSLDRYLRPVVIFLELVLVLFISYRKIGNLRKETKKEEIKKSRIR